MRKERKLFRFDQKISQTHPGILAGIDEVGRGPLAGPVVAASVVFRGPLSLSGLNDSKQVAPVRREILFKKIISHSVVGIGIVSETLIDQINIYQASRLAMRQAVLALPCTPDFLLIDGPMNLDLPLQQVGIIQGDCQSALIAAASIVAKVYRDHFMRKLDSVYPGYGFAAHKGYATPQHLRVLRLKGASEIHRKTFWPVSQEILEMQNG